MSQVPQNEKCQALSLIDEGHSASWSEKIDLRISEVQTSPAWYCARTQPKHEHIAAVSLNRNLGLEVFHPRLRMERATRRGAVRVIEPLFPCYVFVRWMSEDREEIRYVTGIS